MRIDGKEIAAKIFDKLASEVENLKQQSINPHLAIILVGEDESSKAYVRQKELKAQKIGIQTTIKRLSANISEKELLSTIEQLNNANNIHGIIIQRPLPEHIDEKTIDEAVLPKKDIDSFHPNSPFTMPLAASVIEILKNVMKLQDGVAEVEGFPKRGVRSDRQRRETRTSISGRKLLTGPHLIEWIKSKRIVIIGKGKTGGGPTIELLKKLGVQPLIVDSKTQNREELLENADIIISAVGKPNIIKTSELKQGVILIGVGMHRNADSKLQGDYNEEEIKEIASFYTPIPGGIGPVNVAMLLQNLIDAAKKMVSSFVY